MQRLKTAAHICLAVYITACSPDSPKVICSYITSQKWGSMAGEHTVVWELALAGSMLLAHYYQFSENFLNHKSASNAYNF